MKNKRTRQAVTPIIGTVLLLAMAISLFAVLNIIVFSYPQEPKSPSVNLIGAIEKGNINITHYGGESLIPETQVIITIGNSHYDKKISDFPSYDKNLDNKLSFGEILQIPPEEDITNKHVAVTVVDVNSNSIIFTAALQKGGT